MQAVVRSSRITVLPWVLHQDDAAVVPCTGSGTPVRLDCRFRRVAPSRRAQVFAGFRCDLVRYIVAPPIFSPRRVRMNNTGFECLQRPSNRWL